MTRQACRHMRAQAASAGILFVACAALAVAACGVSATKDAGTRPLATTPTATMDYCSPAANPGKATQQVCSDPPITGRKGLPDCGGQRQPTCTPPSPPGTWTPVASTTPADVLDALQRCPDYNPPLQRCPDYNPPLQEFPEFGPGTVSFGTPVLILPATTGPGARAQGMDLPRYIIQAFIHHPQGSMATVVYSTRYDPARRMLQISTTGGQDTNDPHDGRPFPLEGVSANAAVQALQAQRGLGVRPGFAPQLVDFAIDPRTGPPAPSIQWSGGGYNEAVPIWRLVGADGKLYFVGTDGHVYDASQLPIAPDATLTQP